MRYAGEPVAAVVAVDERTAFEALEFIDVKYEELKGLGESPVCVVRNADKAKEVLGADTRTAIAELDDRAAMQKALAGAKRVFIVTGHNPKSDVQQINVIDAAKAAGAEYIVKVSGGRDVIGPNVESVNGQAHYKIEEHLKKSGLKWSILSPGLFMQNILGQAANIKDQGKISGLDRIAIMAALNISHEFLSAKVGNFDVSEFKRRMNSIESTLDQAMADQEKLF